MGENAQLMRPDAAPTTALTLDGTHTVMTPEYVEFNFVLAGLMSRFLAWLLDTVVSVLVAAALLTVLSVTLLAFPGFGSALAFITWFLIDWGYMILLESLWSGQTIGKRALGLRVIQESGVRVSFFQSLLRNVARPIDRLPFFYFVGAIAALFSRSQQRLGDMLAGTIVVKERKLKAPADLPRAEGDTSLLADSDFCARVARLGEEEEAVLTSAVLRREELSIEARLGLFAAIAARLEAQLGFTKPAHLSDEKLTLLVLQAVAARKRSVQK